MRQALHIFKKDVRYLWIEISVALLAAGLLALTASQQTLWLKNSELSRGVISQLIPYLLPLSWWALIVRAVYAETLAGDLEFWPTRPYAWRSLLAAKALLVVLFVNLPLLAAQALLVVKAGFSLGTQWSGLLWSQVLVTLVFVIPVAAIAALTSGIVQFLLMVLAAWVSAMLLSLQFVRLTMLIVGGEWGPLNWWQSYYDLFLLSGAAATVIFWQYKTRRTTAARILGGAAVLIFAIGSPLSWTSAFAMQSKLSREHIDESSLHAGFFSNFKFTTRALLNRDGTVSLHIPLELSGLPAGLIPKSEGLTAEIDGPDGATWRAEGQPWSNVSTTGQLISMQTVMDGAFYRKVKEQPVNLRGYLYLTLYGNRQVSKLPFDEHLRPVPGMGICSASGGNGAPYFLVCNSAFRPSSDLLSITFEPDARRAGAYSHIQQASYSPFPARLALNPVNPFTEYSVFKGPLDAVTVVSLEPRAFVRARIAIDGLRLADYEARLK